MIQVSDKYKKAVYAPIRTANARLYIKKDGITTLYGADKIIDFKIIEELSIISDTVPSNEITITMDNTTGEFSFLTLADAENIISKRIELKIEIAMLLADDIYEWVPMGTYYLVQWKNQVGALTVTMTARDNFDMLSQVPYHVAEASDTLYNLAVNIFFKAGITKYSIDDSLKNISGEFTKDIDSRTDLQMIALAAKSVIWQNRLGAICIKPLEKIGVSQKYYSYCGAPLMYASPMIFPYVDNSYDIKNITYINMFKEPQVKIEKQIADITINGIKIINPNVSNGKSLKIDNPLISIDRAEVVATWIFSESNKAFVYESQWRQNPALECGDVILAQDSFSSKKQTVISKQEFEFAGYLRGKTESRGGL